jgi:hypothetical protein
MPDPHINTFRAKYPGKAKESYNKALRAEIPGGNELLDLLHLVNVARQRPIEDPAAFLMTIEDRLQGIRDAMADEIQRRYQIGAHRP